MSKPQDEFIKILYKINDIYSDLYGGYDLQDDIEHYNSKKSFSKKELTQLKDKCVKEWKSLLIKLCASIIDKINSKKVLGEKLIKQHKKTKIMRSKINNDELALDAYENIYHEIDNIIDEVKIENNVVRRTFRDRLIDGFIGFVMGVVVSIIAYFLGFA